MKFLGCGSSAGRQYQLTVGIEMAAYLLTMYGVMGFVRNHHPLGTELYVLAALPSFPIIGVLVAVAVYLRQEQDEYQRSVMVRCILWGTAAVLTVTAFLGLLQAFGWKGSAPPFFEFVLFWLVMAVAKVYYRFADRVKDDE